MRCQNEFFDLYVKALAYNPLSLKGMEKRDAERIRAIGMAIAAERERRGMSQTELAHVLGFTGSAHISRIESGTRVPNLPTLFAIADTFGVSINYFFVDL